MCRPGGLAVWAAIWPWRVVAAGRMTQASLGVVPGHWLLPVCHKSPSTECMTIDHSTACSQQEQELADQAWWWGEKRASKKNRKVTFEYLSTVLLCIKRFSAIGGFFPLLFSFSWVPGGTQQVRSLFPNLQSNGPQPSLMLWPLNTIPYVVVTPTIELFLLLLQNTYFATRVLCDVNI